MRFENAQNGETRWIKKKNLFQTYLIHCHANMANSWQQAPARQWKALSHASLILFLLFLPSS